MPQTIHLSSPEATRDFLEELAATDKFVFHGSPVLDMDELRPHRSAALHYTKTGERIVTPEPVVCGTTSPFRAVYYGAVLRPVNQRSFRGAAIRPERDANGEVVRDEHFLSAFGKQVVARLPESSLNWTAKEDWQAHPSIGEWRSTTEVPIIGSVAVTHEVLPFSVFDLPAPNDDPSIHRYYQESNWPKETPPIPPKLEDIVCSVDRTKARSYLYPTAQWPVTAREA